MLKQRYLLEVFSPLSFVLSRYATSMWNIVSGTEMPDMKHRENEMFGKVGMHIHARHAHTLHSKEARSQTQILTEYIPTACSHLHVHTETNVHAPGFLRLLLCFISLRHFLPVFNLWSHYLLTHLSSSKWFLFIFCKSPNQSWKLNAIQRSHRFQLHSLSLWKWMAAAESSDVLSHGDGESLNASRDLYRHCLWLKALVGDSTNHVTHLTRYILASVSALSPILTGSACRQPYVLFITIISLHWKEHRQESDLKFHST